VQVIGGVVAMVGVRFKDGVKVQAGDTQLRKIIQMLGDARKVSAKVIGVGHLALFVGQIDRQVSPVGAQGAVSRDILFRGTGIAKAVGKNLVDDPVAQCGRTLLGRVVDGQLPIAVGVQVKLPAHRLVGVDDVQGAVGFGDLKIVKVQFWMSWSISEGVAVKAQVAFTQLHREESVIFHVAAQDKFYLAGQQVLGQTDGKTDAGAGSHSAEGFFKDGKPAVIDAKIHSMIPFRQDDV